MPLLIFTFNRLIYRASEFINHWYIDSFFAFSRFLMLVLGGLDGFFTIRASWRRMIVAPGKMGFWGFLSGIFKVIFGAVIYLILAAAALAGFIAWAMVPPFLILKAAGFNFQW